jgi:hypothetical protein
MSDFLGRLAARALGQVPPLGPRLASRFEQAPALSEEAVETAGTAETAETAAGPRVSPLPGLPKLEAERQGSLTVRSVRENPALATVSRKGGSEKASEQPAPQGRHLNSLGLQPQVDDPQNLLSPEGATLSSRSMPPLPELGETDRLPSLGLKPQAIQMPPLQGGISRTSTRIPTERIDEISSLSVLTPADPQGERIESIEARPSLAPRSALREESPLPGLAVPSPRAPFAESGTAPAAEPVIRVTIGRIEVRAAAPAPPPAPAARPASPQLSLEDYLRRRGEGRL